MTNLDESALVLLACCISRGEHITLETDPAIETGLWCDECRTSTVVRLPLRGISAEGVYELGTVTACTLHDGQADL